MMDARAEGDEYATLGLSPLVGIQEVQGRPLSAGV